LAVPRFGGWIATGGACGYHFPKAAVTWSRLWLPDDSSLTRQFVLTAEGEAFYSAYATFLGSKIISCWYRQLFSHWELNNTAKSEKIQ